MHSHRKTLGKFAVLALLLLLTLGAHAQRYVFANNDAQPNTVSVYQVGSDGSFTEVAGSPFATGGNGSGGGYYASHRIAVWGNFLFATNSQSSNVSVFTIDSSTGVLTPVLGGPFSTGSFTETLAVSPDGRFLFAGGSGITVQSIGIDGSLTQVASYGSGCGTDTLAVSADGKFLAFADTCVIGLYAIDNNGFLTVAPGSPAGDQAGCPTSVAFAQSSTGENRLYVGHCGFPTDPVSAYNVAADGSLTGISGSPFTFNVSQNPNNIAISADGQYLYNASQAGNASPAVLSIVADGSLTLLHSPVGGAAGGGSGMTIVPSSDGIFLYSGSFGGPVYDFNIDSTQALINPHTAPQHGFSPMSIAAFEQLATPTTTSISAPGISYGSDGSVTVTVTANTGSNPPSGSVSLSVDGAPATSMALTAGSGVSASAIFTVSHPSIGPHSLHAAFAAQNGFGASSDDDSLSVSKASTTIDINNIPVAPHLGDFWGLPTFDYTGDGTPYTTSSTTGVCFVDNIGEVTFVAAGECKLTAHATEGTNYLAALGAEQSFTVGKAPSTIDIKNIPAAAIFGGSFTPTYDYFGDGTQYTTSGSTGVCTVDGTTGLVSFIAAGTCKLTAHGNEGANYRAVDGSEQSFTVGKATTTIAISNIPGWTYADFSSIGGLQLNGSATQSGSVLQLTPASAAQAGTAWYGIPVQVANGFDTSFTYNISGGNGADGLTFTVQNQGLSAIAVNGADLGAGGGAGGGITDAVSVSFRSSSYNNIEVDSCGPGNAQVILNNNCALATTGFKFIRPGQHTVRILYVPGTMKVYFDGNIALTHSMTLSDEMNLINGTAYVGFTAGTGVEYDAQQILNWTFSQPASPSAVFGGSFTPTYAYIGDGSTSTTPQGVCTVSGGVVSFIDVGPCALIAHAQAGNNYLAVDGRIQMFTVSKATTTISINNIPAAPKFGDSFTPTYTYGGDGTTSTVSGTTGVCTVDGITGLVKFIAAGNCKLTAKATEGAHYLAATGSEQSFTVGKVSTTISINNIPAAPKFGGSFTPTYAYIGDGTTSTSTGTPLICSVDGTTGLVKFIAAGNCKLTAKATEGANYMGATGSEQSFTVGQAATVTSVTVSPTTAQYSDPVTFTASITPPALYGIAPATSVTFYVGMQSIGTASLVLNQAGTALVAQLTNKPLLEPVPFGTAPTGWMAPGTPTVKAVFNYVNANFTVGTPTTTLTITAEDARVTYSGALFAGTANATSSTATVTLSATIQDISALPSDPAYDAYPGDIRNAKVTFINRDTNTVIAANLPVGLVNASDTKTGTATFNWSVNIGSANSASYTIGVIVTGYYARNKSTDDTVVTVSKPLTTSFITGGGYIVLQTPSGLVGGIPGSKNNFGFNVKYNAGGSNLQGSMNVIVRSNTCVAGLNCSNPAPYVYQVKGNSMTSLSVQVNHATYNGKASIQDITNPQNPIAIDGNATTQVVMTDNGGGTKDTIGFTVWNKSGGVWFTSNWSGTATVQQNLAGGTLIVH